MNVYVNPPKEIYTTIQEFNNFNYWELGAFFVNWKVCFEELENGSIKMLTMSESLADLCIKNHRFKDLEWRVYSRAGMYFCIIPHDNKLNIFIRTKLKNLMLK